MFADVDGMQVMDGLKNPPTADEGISTIGASPFNSAANPGDTGHAMTRYMFGGTPKSDWSPVTTLTLGP